MSSSTIRQNTTGLEEILDTINDLPEAGGGGEGIIEVSVLPTENIDENAVYKVVVKQGPTVYFRIGTIGGKNYTVEGFAAEKGFNEINTYFVDELPSEMLVTENSIVHAYFINSTGIGYVNTGDERGVIDLAEAVGLEKSYGYVNYAGMQLNEGVYVERVKLIGPVWYIRENGEWVRISPDLQLKEVTYTENGDYNIVPDSGKQLSVAMVKVEVPERYNEGYEAGKLDGYSEGYTASQNARQEKSITQNGEYTPDEGYSGFSKVTVNVPQKEEQEKTVNITQNGTKEVTADSGKTLSKVTITTNVSGGGGGYNPLKAFAEGTKTEITAEDLAGAEEIADSAFRGWQAICGVTIPDSVKVIDRYAFSGCILEYLDLGNGVEEIRAGAFEGVFLDEIEIRIPKSVKRIENEVFESLGEGSTIIFEGTPDYIGPKALSVSHGTVTIKVPWSEGEVANAPWGSTGWGTEINVIYNYTE